MKILTKNKYKEMKSYESLSQSLEEQYNNDILALKIEMKEMELRLGKWETDIENILKQNMKATTMKKHLQRVYEENKYKGI